VVIHQRKREATRDAEKANQARSGSRCKGKATRPNYKEMAEADYIIVRCKDWYTFQPRDEEIEDHGFWCQEQLFIYHDVYETLKYPICPMHAIDLPHLQSKTYFDDAVPVIEKMGLSELSIMRCNYNPQLIMQFFTTLMIMPNERKTMKWMSGQNHYESDFYQFSTLLVYSYDGNNLVGRRVHSPGKKPDKNKLVDLYNSTGVVGFTNGLLQLYDQLVHIFRENIAPSGGNNDAIRTLLVDLLYLAH
jgi:hypothetical protein